MKIGTWILTMGLAASAWAQTSTLKAQSTAKPAGVMAAPAARKAAEAKQQPSASAPTSGAAAKHETAKHGKSQKAAPQATEAKPVSATKLVRKGRRDPFVSPIIGKMSSSTNCVGAGKRCLYIGDVRLLGIVQSSNGVIAVVASGRHTYFLREHDPLADGDVERITSETITLRQRSSDVMGRPVMHEVTRKIGAPAV